MIVILLHGFNQTANSFQSAFNTYFDSPPTVYQVSIDAPWQDTTIPGGMAHSWFDYTHNQITRISNGRKKVHSAISSANKLDPVVALVGFSQGANMAIEAAFTSKHIKCILAIQGYPLHETIHKTFSGDNKHMVIWAVLCNEDAIVNKDDAIKKFRFLHRLHPELNIRMQTHHCKHGEFHSIDSNLFLNFMSSCEAQNSAFEIQGE